MIYFYLGNELLSIIETLVGSGCSLRDNSTECNDSERKSKGEYEWLI